MTSFQFPSRRSAVLARQGMVATSQPLAAMAGLRILMAGGNAADAAVTVAALLNVGEPMPTGTGAMSNLKQLISRNVKMKPAVMKSWLIQVASGLNYLHYAYKEPVILRWERWPVSACTILHCVSAIHRDLRSTSIYLRSNTGTIKIGGVEKGHLMKFAHPSVLSGKALFVA